MARLTEVQLAALDQMIAKMTADKVETEQMSADFTDAIVDAVVAVADAAGAAANAIANAGVAVGQAVGDATEAIANAIGGLTTLPADRQEALREQLKGEAPSLEQLVALRSLHR